MDALITINGSLQANARREALNGRSYLVAPVSMIVPGVLKGSRGALYYPPDEVAANPGVWNNVPITLRHPQKNGTPVSASDPDILRTQGLGFIRNDAYDGRRIAEGWFDEQKTRSIAPEVHRALLSGAPMELSTGLHTSNEEAKGVHNGVEYDYIARDYRPDHLAILPDQIGACNLNDGCGLNVNEASKQQLEEFVEEEHEGAEKYDELGYEEQADDERKHEKFFRQKLAENAGKSQPRHKKNGKYLKHSQGAGKSEGEVHDAAAEGYIGACVTGNAQIYNCECGGACAGCETLLAYNRDWPQAKRDKLAKEAPADFAGPHQSYPIKTQSDVDSAAKLIGKAANPDAVKAKIKAIAKRKGLKLPAAWQTQNCGETMNDQYGSDPHSMSKQAASASVMSDHMDAMQHAMQAAGHSKDGNAKRASQMHLKAAGMHEDAATQARRKGNQDTAALHDNAASAHRRASSAHQATLNYSGVAAFTGAPKPPAPPKPKAPKEKKPKKVKGATMNQDADYDFVVNAIAGGGQLPSPKVRTPGTKVPKPKATKVKKTKTKGVATVTQNMEKPELIDWLIVNCDCWDEGDRETLNAFSDDKLANLRAVAQVANAAKKKAAEEDEEDDSEMAEDDSETAENESVENQQYTIDELIANGMLADADAEAIQFMRAQQRQAHRQLAAQIVANAADKKAAQKMVQNMSLAELSRFVKLMPAPQRRQARPTYFGAAGGDQHIENTAEEAPLEALTFNREKVA